MIASVPLANTLDENNPFMGQYRQDQQGIESECFF